MNTCWELLKDFIEKCPEFVRHMKASEHNFGSGKTLAVNPYHAEDVWSHTCMVLLMAEQIQANRLVKLAALLHDVGKPGSLVVKEDRQRHAFIGHEGLSAFLALEYLRTLDLTPNEKVRVMQMISLHIAIFQLLGSEDWETKMAAKFAGQPELLEDLLTLSYCDHQGRFAKDKVVESYPDFRKKFDFVFELLKEPEAAVSPKKNHLTVLVGPPNAGKSTYLRSRGLQANEIILCRDDVILELAGTDDYTEAYRQMDSGVVDAEFNRRIMEAKKEKKSVFLDMTSMSPKARRRNLSTFGKEYEFRAVVFLTAPDVIKVRNRKRGQTEKKFVPESVLDQMMQNFTVPMKDEGFSTIDFVIQE